MSSNIDWEKKIRSEIERYSSLKTAVNPPLVKLNANDLARKIDHTLLRIDASKDEIEELCSEALMYRFYSVCIRASYLSLANRLLQNSAVLPITVVGFPTGLESTKAKEKETQRALLAGAKEVDMVIQLNFLKQGRFEEVIQDILKVKQAAQSVPIKVILETAALSLEEKIAACVLCKEAKVAFVKTSTGFGPGGATIEDVQLMRAVVGPEMGVKASGGIRNYEEACAMVRAGASRLGTSRSVYIVEEA